MNIIRTQKYSYFDYIIIFFTLMYVAVDSINGFIIRSGVNLLSLSQIYKSFIFFFMIVSIMSESKKYFLYLSSLFSIFLLLIIYHSLNYSKLTDFVNDVIFFNKIVFVLVSFLYFKTLLSKNINRIDFIFLLLTIVFISIVCVNIILGIVGIGFESDYGDELGSVGFFYAGNEVSALMIVLAAPLFFLLWEKSIFYYLILAAFLLFIALFKATKVAIFGTILIIICTPLLHEKNRILKLTKLKFKYVIASIVVLPIFGYIVYMIIDQIGILNRWKYFYNKAGILYAVFSGRIDVAPIALGAFLNDYSFLQMLFGKGTVGYKENIARYTGESQIIEVDFLDILLSYGGIGTFCIYTFWISFLIFSGKRFIDKRYYYAPIVFFTNLLLLAASFASGHVLWSGMASLPIGLLNAMMYYKASE